VRAVINALASDSKAKLLASPHIMVSDNNEARIQVGKQVPIPTSETYGQIGVTPQRTIQYKDIGIILKVKPMINDSGLVNMEISQEISDYSIIKLYSNEDQIMLTKTEATTKLVVKDGQTIVIGGLIQETDKNTKSGLPWLLKIPILGYLFGNTTTDKDRTELVILLTPHIVKNQVDAASVTDRFIGKFKDEKMTQEIQKNVSGRTKTAKEPEKKD
jgi:general secretion pathway protein D